MSFWEKLGRIFSGAGGGIITAIGDTVDKFVTTKEEREQLKLALLQLQQDHEQKLRDQVVAEFRAELADRDSARSREVAMAKTEKKDWFMYVAGVVALLSFIGVELAFIFDHRIGLGLESSTGFHQLVGQVEGVTVAIFGYYFGTSKSSADKTRIMGNTNANQSPQ